MSELEKSYFLGNLLILLILVAWCILSYVEDESLYPIISLLGLILYKQFDIRCALLRIIRESNNLLICGLGTIIIDGIGLLFCIKVFIAEILFMYNYTYSRFSVLISQFRQVLIIAFIIMLFDYVVSIWACCYKCDG